jgi:hypothetical protein
MRIYFYTGLLALGISVWSVLEAELADISAIAVCMLVIVIGIVQVIKAKSKRIAWAVLSTSSIASLAWMLVAVHMVRVDADNFATDFIKNFPCQPSYSELLAESPGWIHESGHVEKKIERFGATRLVTYQDNGLFRYGFLYDDTRSVWLRKCDRN